MGIDGSPFTKYTKINQSFKRKHKHIFFNQVIRKYRRRENVSMTLGEQVRKYRMLKEWSQKELGERAGLKHNTISEMETNSEGSVKAITKVAEALGIDRDYLFKKD
jgi:ribosome-binding protein aMBF1 (putative translation factor)